MARTTTVTITCDRCKTDLKFDFQKPFRIGSILVRHIIAGEEHVRHLTVDMDFCGTFCMYATLDELILAQRKELDEALALAALENTETNADIGEELPDDPE